MDSRWILSRATACALVGVAATARAGLTLDLLTASGNKSAIISAPGDMVQMQVWGIVTGTDATGANDGLKIAQGSFLSGSGGLLGNLTGGLVAPFDAIGSQAGTSQDLDADGDLDLGGAVASSASGFWAARSAQPQSPNGYPSASVPPSSYGTVDGASYRVQLGTVTFTATGAAAGGTSVSFAPRAWSTAAQWFEEVLSPDKTPTSGIFAAGAIPVTITLRPEWASDQDGSWSEGGKWSAAMPDGAGVGAQFLGAIQQPRTITLDSDRVLGYLTLNNVITYTVDGPGALTLNGAADDAFVSVRGGSHHIAAPVNLATDAGVDVAPGSRMTFSGAISGSSRALTKQGDGAIVLGSVSVGRLEVAQGAAEVAPNGGPAGVCYVKSLSIAPTAKLDLNDNDLVIEYGTRANPFAEVRALVFAGYSASPDPSRTGIVSSTGQNNGTMILALLDNALLGAGDWPLGSGRAIDVNSVIGKYTYFGDANLDGQVSADDYAILDANLNTAPPAGMAWLSGDANLDGAVSGDDYAILDSTLGSGAANAPAPSSVPEPGGLLLPAGLLALRHRRERRTR